MLIPSRSIVEPSCPVDWSHPLNQGLLGWWMVAPNSGWRGGQRFRDLVRGGRTAHDGTLTNGALGANNPTFGGPLGRPGGYGTLNFVRGSFTGGIVDVTNSISAFAVGTAITFGCWVRLAEFTNTTQSYISKRGGGEEFSLFQNGTVLTVRINGGPNALTYTFTPSAGIWYHYFATYDNATIVLYINGLQVATQANTNSAVTPANDVFFGELPGNNGFYLDGAMDDIRIYNRCLSPAQIYQLYEQSKLGHKDTLRWITGVPFFPAQPATDSLFTCDGDSTASFTGAATTSTSFTCAGAATVSFTGAETAAGSFSCDGSASTSFVGSSLFKGTFSCAGDSTCSGVGSSLFKAVFSCDGSATCSFTSATPGVGAFSCDGSASTSLVGSSLFKGVFSSDGLASSAWTGTGSVFAVFQADGLATCSGVGRASANGVFSAAGLATADWVGHAVGTHRVFRGATRVRSGQSANASVRKRYSGSQSVR